MITRIRVIAPSNRLDTLGLFIPHSIILTRTNKHVSHLRLERRYQSHIPHPLYVSSFSAR
uniref:Uncharacterized protein n=1 Tax=virus sp. ct9pU4 TaxID=2828248 RepID=A0A8S5RBC9_9VIRU|nr:MAG TPA: hypothetical protein [virus sp. ct9pU4]